MKRIDTPTQNAPDVGARALLRLAGPIFVAQLAVMGLAVIDTMMAGRLSAADLAAVAVGSSIYVSVYVAFMGILQALTPIAGHHYGAGRFTEIGADLVQALWLALFWRWLASRSLRSPIRCCAWRELRLTSRASPRSTSMRLHGACQHRSARAPSSH